MVDELEAFGADRIFAWDDYSAVGNVRNEMSAKTIYEKYYPWWKSKIEEKQKMHNCWSEEELNNILRFDVCMSDFLAVNYAWEKKTAI